MDLPGGEGVGYAVAAVVGLAYVVEKLVALRKATVGPTEARVAAMEAKFESTNDAQWQRINGGFDKHWSRIDDLSTRVTRLETKVEMGREREK